MNSKSQNPEWKYEMRREMQEIIPGLFIGPYSVLRELHVLKSHGITAILCLRDVKEDHLLKNLYPGEFLHHVMYSLFSHPKDMFLTLRWKI